MFKIEVQADSIPQLADRLLALGAQLSIPAETGLQRIVSQVQATVAATETEAPKRTRGPNKPKPEPEVEAAQEQTPEPEAQTESMVAAAEAPAEEVVAEVEHGVVAASLDFDKDVAPRVLDLVARKGREAMTRILDQFGAARASEIDTAQWPEFIAQLEEAAA